MVRVIYKDKFLTIKERTITVRGKRLKMHRYEQDDVVVILPLVKKGVFLLERQFRHGIDKYLLEFPAGHMEKGENAKFAAIREFEEETGYKPRKIRHLFSELSNPAVSKRQFHYFLAEDLVKAGKKHFDDYEILETLEMPDAKLWKLIGQNKLKDPKTIAGYLYYKNFVEKQ
ncbi:MAG: NUDIX hydrolase [Candidatus Micrarchaeota archaeon]|nr:NUDIX hydrolase [Candidatus Micrarchaeota archaeon]